MVFIMQNYTNHFELLIGQIYFVENKTASSEPALFIFEGDVSYPFTHSLHWRSKGDYNDLFDFSREDVDSMMEPTKHFIDKVASLIELE